MITQYIRCTHTQNKLQNVPIQPRWYVKTQRFIQFCSIRWTCTKKSIFTIFFQYFHPAYIVYLCLSICEIWIYRSISPMFFFFFLFNVHNTLYVSIQNLRHRHRLTLIDLRFLWVSCNETKARSTTINSPYRIGVNNSIRPIVLNL